jgi:hypothetical protein
MPGVLYTLPVQMPQQGPTCWYYCIKVIMKHHNLIGTGRPLQDPMKALHRVRQTITDLKNRNLGHDNLTTIRNQLSGRYNTSIDPLERTQLRAAVQRLGAMINTDRMNYLTEFLGPDANRIRPLNIQPWSINGVITTITQHGPFYISVDRGPRASTQKADANVPGGISYRIKADNFIGGPHAMVVCGAWQDPSPGPVNHVSSDRQRVYLWDPNDPRTVFYAAWDDLQGQLNTPAPFTGTVIGVAIDCNPAVVGGCAHRNPAQLP